MNETANTTQSQANDNVNAPAAEAPVPTGVEAVRAKVQGKIDDLFIVGVELADKGLSYVKLAVEKGAAALERTAKQIEVYQARFKKDAPSVSA